MRKIVLALFLTLAAIACGPGRAFAMEGFDLGEMPPLPPPLLDSDSSDAGALTPPPSGAQSPLMQGSGVAAGTGSVAAPPLGSADAGRSASRDTFAPPAPPPLAPPPIVPDQPAIGLPADSGFPAVALQPQTGAAAMDETPQPGKIVGGRVNVRAGPNTQYESVAVLTTGAPVTVLARHGDWYKIVFPADQLASIHKNYVTADITGEIPETGLPGVVNQDNADVHAFYWDKSTVVARLNRGDPVTIKQERGQWYRIDAPASARAYVFAQYVRVDGGGQVAADTAPAPANEAVDLAVSGEGGKSETKLSARDKELLAIKESYYSRQRERIEAERQAEQRAIEEAIASKKRQGEQLDLALKDLDERLAAIDKETADRMTYYSQVASPPTLTTLGSAAWAPPDPASGGYTGWVENIGRVGNSPSAYRLTKGGEIRFYLRSGIYNLGEFTNRRVWLNGQIEPASGASAGVLNVDQIRILTELEIAEGMRESPGYAGDNAANPNPYYDNSSYNATYYGGTAPYDASPYGGATPYGGAVPYDGAIPYDAPAYGAGGYGGYVPGTAGTPELIIPSAGNAPQPPAGTYVDPFAAYPGTAAAPGAGVYTAQPVYGSAQPAPTPAPAAVPAAPARQGPTPSDPSQLPDVVGSGYTNPYPSGGLPAFGAGGTPGGSMGEVDSDHYENPIISEIAP